MKKIPFSATVLRMKSESSGSEFLRRKYKGLSSSEEVEDVLAFTGQEIPPTDPEARLEAYLGFLRELVDRPNAEERERGIEAIKQSLYARHIIKPEEIPEAYFEAIEHRNRDEGRSDIKLPSEVRHELANTLIVDQRKSLDRWIDQLASDEMRDIPDWLKYFTMRSVVRMGRFDKETKSFTDRTGGTTAPFPDLNHEALIVVLEDLKTKYGATENTIADSPKIQFTGRYDISPESKQKYSKALEAKNFSKLYTLTLEEYKPIPDELLQNTKGEWRHYERGSDPAPLVDSIAPYGTGWCIRGEGMAKQYLQGGAHTQANELFVYYSEDKNSQPIIPRVVMVINSNNQIDEVRGIWPGENLDPYIGDVVREKLAEHPDGARYQKKSSDMSRLTEIYYKTHPEKNPSRSRKQPSLPEPLTKDDLIFLYGINGPIEGFGLTGQEDQRIAELRKERDPKVDAPIILDCSPEQIATNQSEITEDTKAYIGPFFTDIVKDAKYNYLGHIYTSFPEKRIRFETTLNGGKTKDQLKAELAAQKINFNYAGQMMDNEEFVITSKAEKLDLVRLTVADLGFPSGATIEQIFAKAESLGLELCPSDLGPNYRLNYLNQPLDEWIYIGMKPISDADGDPGVFLLARDGFGLWLLDFFAAPWYRWGPDIQFVFRRRKPALPAGRSDS